MSNNTFMKSREGYKGVNLKGYAFTLILYNNANSVVVMFDNTGTEVHTSWSAVKDGKVKDNFEPSVRGVGIIGNNKTRDTNGVKIPSYASWECMLQRCYDKKYHKIRPTYKDVTVCDEWLTYGNFKEWYDMNYIEGCFLDKDLTKFGNQVYCPEFCHYVPHKINSILEDARAARGDLPIGISQTKHGYRAKVSMKPDRGTKDYRSNSLSQCVAWYKTTKENYVKDIAIEYYSKGLISLDIYNSLLSFTVEKIND